MQTLKLLLTCFYFQDKQPSKYKMREFFIYQSHKRMILPEAVA